MYKVFCAALPNVVDNKIDKDNPIKGYECQIISMGDQMLFRWNISFSSFRRMNRILKVNPHIKKNRVIRRRHCFSAIVNK